MVFCFVALSSLPSTDSDFITIAVLSTDQCPKLAKSISKFSETEATATTQTPDKRSPNIFYLNLLCSTHPRPPTSKVPLPTPTDLLSLYFLALLKKNC